MAEEKKCSAICRVCLDFECMSGKGLSLFEEYNDCVISDKINALTNIGIKAGDGLPDRICPNCLLELDGAYKFRQKCEKTNEILLTAVNNAPIQFENLDIALPMKEEYLEDEIDYEYIDDDDNITLSELQAADADIKTLVVLPQTSTSSKLECHDCGEYFKSKCKLRVHWKKVHLTENLKCSTCLRIFKSYGAYNSHKKKNSQSCATASKVRIEGEGKTRVFYCKDCNYKSLRIKDIAAHIITHTGERPYQCDICLRTYTQLSSLSAHKESSHKLYKTEGTCHYCGKHIKGQVQLHRHMLRHKVSNITCKICNVVLKTKDSFKNHMRRHSGIKAYACEICPTSFFTPSELYNHKSKVHLKTSKIYKCGICNYTSQSHSAMAKHRPKHSSTNIACDFCGFFVDNEQQLFLHKKRHTDRNYPCSQCERVYYSRKNLSSHVRKTHRLIKLSGCGLKANSVKSEHSLEIEVPSQVKKFNYTQRPLT